MPGCLSVSQTCSHVCTIEACRVTPKLFSGKWRYPGSREHVFSSQGFQAGPGMKWTHHWPGSTVSRSGVCLAVVCQDHTGANTAQGHSPSLNEDGNSGRTSQPPFRKRVIKTFFKKKNYSRKCQVLVQCLVAIASKKEIIKRLKRDWKKIPELLCASQLESECQNIPLAAVLWADFLLSLEYTFFFFGMRNCTCQDFKSNE